MDIKVRKAEHADLERVNLLRRQVNDVHVAGRPDIFRAGFCDEMRDRLYKVFEDDGFDVIVSETDGIICGFAVIEYAVKPLSPYNNERKIFRIEEFGVDEACRRQGVASAMIDYLKGYAREQGYNKIELDVWEFNRPAVSFYEKVGFEPYRRYLEMNL